MGGCRFVRPATTRGPDDLFRHGVDRFFVVVRNHWCEYATRLLVLAVWWNLGLMVQFGARLMDRQRLDPARTRTIIS